MHSDLCWRKDSQSDWSINQFEQLHNQSSQYLSQFRLLRLLYLIEEIHGPVITLKAVGHQWYWRYEFSDFTNLEFDSYVVQQEDQQTNIFRLLVTGNRVVLPINSSIRIIVTVVDVLHSWTVPRLWVKTDATSGRLIQVRFSINRPGLLYGKCSEICGAGNTGKWI